MAVWKLKRDIDMIDDIKTYINSRALNSHVRNEYISNFGFFDTMEEAEKALMTDIEKFLPEMCSLVVWEIEPVINEQDGKFQPYTRFILA